MKNLSPWVCLFLAGIFEIALGITIKYSQGYTRLIPSLLNLVAMFFSIYFLSLAVKTIPLGTAYAVWTGIGAVGLALVGMLFFGESSHSLRLLFLFLIISGMVGLKLTKDF